MADGGQQTATLPSVTIDWDTAKEAERELRLLIEATEAVEEHGDAMTPLARVRQRINDQLDVDEHHDVLVQVLDIIEQVGDDTGTETAPTDPLTGNILSAHQNLKEAMEDASEEAAANGGVSYTPLEEFAGTIAGKLCLDATAVAAQGVAKIHATQAALKDAQQRLEDDGHNTELYEAGEVYDHPTMLVHPRPGDLEREAEAAHVDATADAEVCRCGGCERVWAHELPTEGEDPDCPYCGTRRSDEATEVTRVAF